MDVVVKAHHCTVTDRFHDYVADKITRLEKLNQRAIRVEVEVSAEKNKRQHDTASRVEITLRTKGPVVRGRGIGGGEGRRLRPHSGQVDGSAAQGGGSSPGAPRIPSPDLGR